MKKALAITALALSLSSFCHAAPAHVQSTVCDGCSTLAYGSNVTAGSMLVAVFRCGSANVTMAYTDTLGNSWSSAVSNNNPLDANTELDISYALNSGAGANTVNPGTSDDTCGTRRWIIMEYSGVATSSALDQTNSATFSAATSANSGNITTTQNEEVAICGTQSSNNDNWTISSPFTERQNGTKVNAGDNVLATTQTLSCTATGSSDSGGIAIASFKAPAAGGGSAPPNPRRIIITE